MTRHPFTIGGLGEIAIRCADMDAMCGFYHDTLGLPILSDSRDTAGIVFFALPGGVAGHTSVLALFRHDAGRANLHPTADTPPETGARSSLHHFALSLRHEEQEKAIAFFDRKDVDYVIQIFDWIGWRGVFTTDPEGNTVELVAHHPDYLKGHG